ncbi:MAG TPA: YiiD C-terminal domain-containing protein [Gammaproteobacteria bacterium]|nr:YiiD C-terminal domain-containing protein [Gammaproteobacteria bacterium]
MTEASAHFRKLLADPQAECRALETYVRAHIPLTQAMQVHATTLDAHGLTLSAPLAANHNHQDSAFGGSLASLAMLAGWGLLWLSLDHGRGINIVVRDMHMDFLHLVNGGLRATCALPTIAAWEKFTATLTRRRKARLELRIEIICDAVLCARCTGMFVAYREAAGDG